MGFRFRKRTRLFPGLYLNWSKNGLSSISLGGPGATVNIPVNREGGARGTVGLPGTGLSYTEALSSGQPQAGLPDDEIHTGPRGGQWFWRRSRDGSVYKDYLSTSERRQAQRQVPSLTSTESVVQELMDFYLNDPGSSAKIIVTPLLTSIQAKATKL